MRDVAKTAAPNVRRRVEGPRGREDGRVVASADAVAASPRLVLRPVAVSLEDHVMLRRTPERNDR